MFWKQTLFVFGLVKLFYHWQKWLWKMNPDARKCTCTSGSNEDFSLIWICTMLTWTNQRLHVPEIPLAKVDALPDRILPLVYMRKIIFNRVQVHSERAIFLDLDVRWCSGGRFAWDKNLSGVDTFSWEVALSKYFCLPRQSGSALKDWVRHLSCVSVIG